MHHAGIADVVGPATWITGQGDGPRGRAVVGAVARNDLVPAGDPARHLDRILVCLGAAKGEEDFVDVAGQQLGQLLTQPGSRLVGHEWVDEYQFLSLPLDGVDDAWVTMAGIDAHELAVEVDDALAVRCIEIDALRVIDCNRVYRGLGGPVVEGVLPAEGDDLLAAQDMRARARL